MPIVTPSLFNKAAIRREHLFMEYPRVTASSRYRPEKLFIKFLKNSQENNIEGRWPDKSNR